MTEDAPRITGLAVIDKPLADLLAIPRASLQRRALYVTLLAAGVTMTAFGSIFLKNLPPIPFRIFPDVRPVLLLASGAFLGIQAAGGGAARRKLALWGTIGFVLVFHLEEATVHWIGPYPGSITGQRIGWLGTSGSLLALASVLLLHVEVESARLAADARKRGIGGAEAEALSRGLRGAGARSVVAIAAAAAGLGVLVTAGEAVFGNDASGGAYVLLVGGALLLVAAVLLARWTPRAAGAQADEEPASP